MALHRMAVSVVLLAFLAGLILVSGYEPPLPKSAVPARFEVTTALQPDGLTTYWLVDHGDHKVYGEWATEREALDYAVRLP